MPVEPYAMAIGIDVGIAHVGVAVHQTKGTGLRALPFVQLGVNTIKARMIFDQPIRQNTGIRATGEIGVDVGQHQLDLVDRESVVSGKSVSVRVDLGGRRSIKKKK